MTESDAKQKWCPMFEGWVSDSEGGGTHYKCKGSDCMMWRWDVDKCRRGPEIDHGYCGLAGEPYWRGRHD